MFRFNHFDILAPLYDRLIQTPELSQLVQMTALPVTGRLLDAGGGTGRIATGLLGQADQIVIADSSLRMLGEALGKNGLDPVGSETEALPFCNGCFERVLVVDAYHHLADQGRSLQEFWRVLSPGGRLVIEEPDIHRFSVKLVALAEKITFFRSHFVSAEKIVQRLDRLGADTSVHRHGHTVWVVAEKPI
jgi:demethylmenaquinone methyltransferase/2-methoxy-6-polyprenyl-1,4-benzoquinol methylase